MRHGAIHEGQEKTTVLRDDPTENSRLVICNIYKPMYRNTQDQYTVINIGRTEAGHAVRDGRQASTVTSQPLGPTFGPPTIGTETFNPTAAGTQ